MRLGIMVEIEVPYSEQTHIYESRIRQALRTNALTDGLMGLKVKTAWTALSAAEKMQLLAADDDALN